MALPKTTTTLTVGKELARRGFKVLLVDMDPQASLTTVMGVRRLKKDYALQDFIGGVGSEPIDLESVVERFEDVD